jgi:hypothetical protein
MMKLKKKAIVASIIIGIIIISNTIPVSFVLGFLTQDRTFYGFDFLYNSGKCGFSNRGSYVETHEELLAEFDKYKAENPDDSTLYRTFKINPLKFWFWKEYLLEPKYRLPYKDPCPDE